jgi:hypothetical protein
MGQVLDFAQFLKYKTVEVPIQCGSKTGKIYTFSHRDNLKNGLLANYERDLKNLIEKKKYEDSVKSCCDIGPTATVANLMEDGDYTEFIKNYSALMTGLEHVLRVEETIGGEDISHSIMPLKGDNQRFATEEQEALMRYSFYFKKLVDPKKEFDNNAIIEWVYDEENAKVFREEILKKCNKNIIPGYPREYFNCAIYKNLYREIIKRYSIDEKEVNDINNKKIAVEEAFLV